MIVIVGFKRSGDEIEVRTVPKTTRQNQPKLIIPGHLLATGFDAEHHQSAFYQAVDLRFRQVCKPYFLPRCEEQGTVCRTIMPIRRNNLPRSASSDIVHIEGREWVEETQSDNE